MKLVGERANIESADVELRRANQDLNECHQIKE